MYFEKKRFEFSFNAFGTWFMMFPHRKRGQLYHVSIFYFSLDLQISCETDLLIISCGRGHTAQLFITIKWVQFLCKKKVQVLGILFPGSQTFLVEFVTARVLNFLT